MPLSPLVNFAVATIKQVSASDLDPMMMMMSFLRRWVLPPKCPDRLSSSASLLPATIDFIQDDLVLGLPGWTRSERYDMDAKVDDEDIPKWKILSPSQRRLALQSLLVSRLTIEFKHEIHERPTYPLVIAKNGSKFRETQLPETATGDTSGSNGTVDSRSTVTPGNIVLKGSTFSAFASLLSMQGLDHAVLDKTGLTGTYDISLRWSPNDIESLNPSLPSLLTALQEQLGLNSNTRKVPSL